MRFTCPLLLPAVMALAACSDFPALDGVVPATVADQPFPALVPLAPVIARAGASDAGGIDAQTDIAPRLAALRARAARLRGPVIAPAFRAQMLRGVR